MLKRVSSAVMLAGITTITTAALYTVPVGADLTVHEWGTFTTVAGTDGRAIEWLPLGGPTDLPCFVHHFRGGVTKIVPGLQVGTPLIYETARNALLGKVRMETPVIYFYTPEQITASVSVRFPRGLITEFYPMGYSHGVGLTAQSLRDPNRVGYIEWANLNVGPSVPPLFKNEGGDSHYYAARATDASPLSAGPEHEKFLFYRGVASFDVPIQTIARDDGRIEIANIGIHGPLPAVVLFERRGAKLGYRIGGELALSTTMDPPTLDGSLPALRADLERMLIKAGLYQKEAAAMVETWKDSWFEDGTRVFYILPPQTVNDILPLRVSPEPSSTKRVFVGRMDVITPTTIDIVQRAIAADDRATLELYSRFLSPIADRIVAHGVDAATEGRIRRITSAVFAGYVKRSLVCE